MRVKNTKVTRKYRKSIKRQASGYYGTKHTSYRIANQQLIRSKQYAFRDRKAKKRDFRKLWIARISAATRSLNISYSVFINGLKKQNILINRKMLAELAIHNKAEFEKIVKQAIKK